MTMFACHGNSITGGSPIPGAAYPEMFRELRRRQRGDTTIVVENYGAGGQSTSKLPHFFLWRRQPAAGVIFTHMSATVDWNQIPATNLDFFKAMTLAQISFLAGTPRRFADPAAGWSLFAPATATAPGSWTDAKMYGTNGTTGYVNKVTKQHGAVIEGLFNGPRLDLVRTVIDGSQAKIAVKVLDGTELVVDLMFPVASPQTINRGDGFDRTLVLDRIGGLDPTKQHRLLIATLISRVGDEVALDWIDTGPGPAQLWLLSSPLADASIFPAAPMVADYNEATRILAEIARGVGQNVTWFDVCADAELNTTTDLRDGSHPGLGALKLAMSLHERLPV